MPKINREGFCIVCNKYQNVKRLNNCYQCLTCGAKHKVKVVSGEPHLIGVVQLTNKKYVRKAVIIHQEEITMENYQPGVDSVGDVFRTTIKPLDKSWKKVTRRHRWDVNLKTRKVIAN